MDPLLTAEEVARILNVKVSTVYDGVHRGLLPAVRIWKGRRRTLVRFRREDLEEFIRQRATAPAGQDASSSRAR